PRGARKRNRSVHAKRQSSKNSSRRNAAAVFDRKETHAESDDRDQILAVGQPIRRLPNSSGTFRIRRLTEKSFRHRSRTRSRNKMETSLAAEWQIELDADVGSRRRRSLSREKRLNSPECPTRTFQTGVLCLPSSQNRDRPHKKPRMHLGCGGWKTAVFRWGQPRRARQPDAQIRLR